MHEIVMYIAVRSCNQNPKPFLHLHISRSVNGFDIGMIDRQSASQESSQVIVCDLECYQNVLLFHKEDIAFKYRFHR